MAKIIRIEKYIFYTLVFLLFFQGRLILFSFSLGFNEWTSAYLYLTDILIAVLIFFWLARYYQKISWRDLKNSASGAEIVLATFLLISALSVAVSNKFSLSVYGWLKIFEFALLFFYVSHNFYKLFDLRRFWQIFLAGALLQATVALTQFFWQRSLGIKYLESPLRADLAGVAKIDLAGQKIIRAYGLVPHPNILAAILIVAIFGLAYLFIRDYASAKKWLKITYAVALIIILAALFFTFSRAVSAVGLCLLFGWLAINYWRQKETRRPAIVITALLLAISCLFLVVYWQYFSVRYDAVALGKSQSFNLRNFYNQTAWFYFKNAPVFGLGQSNFVWSFSQKAYLPAWVYQPVHNIYLLIATETGGLGLLAFLVFLFFTIKSAWRSRSGLAASCFLSLVACLLVVGLFDHFLWDLQQGQILFWLLLGILAGLSAHSSLLRSNCI